LRGTGRLAPTIGRGDLKTIPLSLRKWKRKSAPIIVAAAAAA
jgi:hypothetical protein